MNAGLMPELLEKIQKKFRPMEVRPGAPLPKLSGTLPYVKEMSGYPRFCGSTMGAEVLWEMDILEKAAAKPKDTDFTAEYTVAGRHTRVLGRNHRYLDYPVNVFLNICMLHDGQVEIFDFCINLLAEIATVNWYAQRLPEEMRGVRDRRKGRLCFRQEERNHYPEYSHGGLQAFASFTHIDVGGGRKSDVASLSGRELLREAGVRVRKTKCPLQKKNFVL